MRKALLLCLISFPCLAAAHADTIDDFVLTGDSYVISYSLPATSSIPNDQLFGVFAGTASTTINGVPGYLETIQYNDTRIYPFLSLVFPIPNSASSIDLLGPTFLNFVYTYPCNCNATVTTTFLPGTYTLEELTSNLQPVTPTDDFTLTITPEVPEPSPLVMLATGMALLFLLRRAASLRLAASAR